MKQLSHSISTANLSSFLQICNTEPLKNLSLFPSNPKQQKWKSLERSRLKNKNKFLCRLKFVAFTPIKNTVKRISRWWVEVASSLQCWMRRKFLVKLVMNKVSGLIPVRGKLKGRMCMGITIKDRSVVYLLWKLKMELFFPSLSTIAQSWEIEVQLQKNQKGQSQDFLNLLDQ